MSKLKSLEKLRKYELFDRGIQISAYMPSDELADEIQAEVNERYMELPVDADNVVIRPGDIIYRKDMRYAKKKVPCVVTAVGTDVFACTDSLMRDASDYFHINTRTLTDVLADLFDRKISITDAEHEISELLGGDAK